MCKNVNETLFEQYCLTCCSPARAWSKSTNQGSQLALQARPGVTLHTAERKTALFSHSALANAAGQSSQNQSFVFSAALLRVDGLVAQAVHPPLEVYD